jgi:hypothetical protein
LRRPEAGIHELAAQFSTIAPNIKIVMRLKDEWLVGSFMSMLVLGFCSIFIVTITSLFAPFLAW